MLHSLSKAVASADTDVSGAKETVESLLLRNCWPNVSNNNAPSSLFPHPHYNQHQLKSLNFSTTTPHLPLIYSHLLNATLDVAKQQQKLTNAFPSEQLLQKLLLMNATNGKFAGESEASIASFSPPFFPSSTLSSSSINPDGFFGNTRNFVGGTTTATFLHPHQQQQPITITPTFTVPTINDDDNIPQQQSAARQQQLLLHNALLQYLLLLLLPQSKKASSFVDTPPFSLSPLGEAPASFPLSSNFTELFSTTAKASAPSTPVSPDFDVRKVFGSDSLFTSLFSRHTNDSSNSSLLDEHQTNNNNHSSPPSNTSSTSSADQHSNLSSEVLPATLLLPPPSYKESQQHQFFHTKTAQDDDVGKKQHARHLKADIESSNDAIRHPKYSNRKRPISQTDIVATSKTTKKDSDENLSIGLQPPSINNQEKPRRKHKKRSRCDSVTNSPVNGMFIKETFETTHSAATAVVEGVLDDSAAYVQVSDESRAAIGRIPNVIGQPVCFLCKACFVDVFKLAMHKCPRIGYVEHRCDECDKVFSCPANLASHLRWHAHRCSSQKSEKRPTPLLPHEQDENDDKQQSETAANPAATAVLLLPFAAAVADENGGVGNDP